MTLLTLQTTFIIRSSDHKQNSESKSEGSKYSKCMKTWQLASTWKLLFIVTGAYYESGLYCWFFFYFLSSVLSRMCNQVLL